MEIDGKAVSALPVSPKYKGLKVRTQKPLVNWKSLPWGQESTAKKHDPAIKRHNFNNVTTYNRIPIPKLDLSWVDNPDHSLDTPVDVRCPKEKLPDPKSRRKWSARTKSGEKDSNHQPLVDACPMKLSEEGTTFLTIKPMERKTLPPLNEDEKGLPSKLPQHCSYIGRGKELILRTFQTGARAAHPPIRLPKLEGGPEAAKCTLQKIRPKSGKFSYEKKPLSVIKTRGEAHKIPKDVKSTSMNGTKIKRLESAQSEKKHETFPKSTPSKREVGGKNTLPKRTERGDEALPKCPDMANGASRIHVERGDDQLQNSAGGANDTLSKGTASVNDPLPTRLEFRDETHKDRIERLNDTPSKSSKRLQKLETIQVSEPVVQKEVLELEKEGKHQLTEAFKVHMEIKKSIRMIRAQSDTVTFRHEKEEIYQRKRSKSENVVKGGCKERIKHNTSESLLADVAKVILLPLPLPAGPFEKTPLPDIAPTRPESAYSLTPETEEIQLDIQVSLTHVPEISPSEIIAPKSALAGIEIAITDPEDEEEELECETSFIPIEETFIPMEREQILFELESLQREINQRQEEVDHYFQEQIAIDSKMENILESAEEQHANLMAVNALNRDMESSIKLLHSEMYETKLDAKNYEISIQREVADYGYLMNIFTALRKQMPIDFQIKVPLPPNK